MTQKKRVAYIKSNQPFTMVIDLERGGVTEVEVSTPLPVKEIDPINLPGIYEITIPPLNEGTHEIELIDEDLCLQIEAINKGEET